MKKLKSLVVLTVAAVSSAQGAMMVIRMPEPAIVAELAAGAAMAGFVIWRFSKKK